MEKKKNIAVGIIDDNEEDTNIVLASLKNKAEQYGYGLKTTFFKVVNNKNQEAETDEKKIEDSIKGLIDELKKFYKREDTKVLIIDFVLSVTLAPFGSSLALRLKEEHENFSFLNKMPFVGISSIERNDPRLTEHRELEFIDIFERKDIDKHALSIFQIAQDYGLILETGIHEEDERKNYLFDILNVPESNKELLWRALPSVFKKDWDTDTPHSLSRWIWNVFLKKPGFLLNEFYVATLFGLKKESFNKIKNKFKDARYKGIYAIDSNPLWWKNDLQSILIEKVEPDKLMPIWKRAHKFSKEFTEKDFAVCSISEKHDLKLIPAYKDHTRSKLVPIAYELTKDDPNENVKVGFDVIRLYMEA